MINPVLVGISTCLLGENVRYDGGHKLDRFIRDTFGQFVEFVPVCPEVECGLPIPREAMHLEGETDHPRLITTRTRRDLSEQMYSWAELRLEEIADVPLSGYIFKTRSPSSGMRGIKVLSNGGKTVRMGSGIWAGLFMKRFPLIPVEDEGRLHDPGLRENFIERVFTFARWRTIADVKSKKIGDLVTFHTIHKLLVMAHSIKHYRALGKLVANGKSRDMDELYAEYIAGLMEALKLRATVKKNVNVLHHIMGYFKKQLSPDEKQEVRGIIDEYAKGFVPLIVPVTILNHFVRKYDQPYLKTQVYLKPHPSELKLRNHA